MDRIERINIKGIKQAPTMMTMSLLSDLFMTLKTLSGGNLGTLDMNMSASLFKQTAVHCVCVTIFIVGPFSRDSANTLLLWRNSFKVSKGFFFTWQTTDWNDDVFTHL